MRQLQRVSPYLEQIKMNHRKMFLAVILLILTQFAWGTTNYAGSVYEDIKSKLPKEFIYSPETLIRFS